MPGLITHYICADACLSRLQDTEIKHVLNNNRQMYNVGAQGPDVFFYYLPCLYKKSIRQLGNTVHKTKVNAFFEKLIISIAAIKRKGEREAAIAYLAGYLTHYALDANAHPYIYYKSGFKTNGDHTRKIRHSVNHRNFETNIDILMLKIISSEKPSDKKIWQFVKVTSKEAGVTAKILSEALKSVYNVHLSNKQVYRAFHSMYAVNRLIQSKRGRRKRIMQFVENFTVGEHVLTSLIHDQAVSNAIDFLNLKKQTWHFPWEDNVAQTHSFMDMFERSVTEASELIESLFAYFNGSLSLDNLLRFIGNKSLATGVDSDQALQFQFSDVVYKKGVK